MGDAEILKELYKEEFNKLIKMDVYKIVRKLQILHRKEEILKSLDLHDNKLIESLPESLRNRINELKTENQITDYIGTWGKLNPRSESGRLMDKDVYNLRGERTEEQAKIEDKNNSEIRDFFYAFAKVKKIETLLEEKGISVCLDDKDNIKWIYRNKDR